MALTKEEQENMDSYSSEKSLEEYSREELTDVERIILEKYFKNGMKILDLGCGCGRTTKHIFDLGCEVVGVDIVQNMVELAKKKFPKIKFEVGDACKLDFEKEKFDAVLMAFNSLDYIFPEEKRISAIKECRRVLKPGGLFIFSSHNSMCIKPRPRFLLRNIFNFSKYKIDVQDFGRLTCYYDSPANVIRQAEEQGFSLLAIESRYRSRTAVNLFDEYLYYVFRKV